LKARKAIKEAIPECEKELVTAGNAIGVPLVLVDNTADIYNAISDKEGMGQMPKYFNNFQVRIVEAAKNATVKEALAEKMNACGGKVCLKMYTLASGESEPYFKYDNESFNICVQPGSWGTWITYHDVDKLQKAITVTYEGVEMPLEAKKSIIDVLPTIESDMAIIASALGAEKIEFGLNWGELWTWLVKHGNKHNPETVGPTIVKYTNKVAAVVKEFCGDADNKEALEDAWSNKKLNFVLESSNEADTPFQWKEGALTVQIKGNYWGTWIDSTYKGEALEKTL